MWKHGGGERFVLISGVRITSTWLEIEVMADRIMWASSLKSRRIYIRQSQNYSKVSKCMFFADSLRHPSHNNTK